MAAPPLVSGKECVLALGRLGYVQTRQRGSHLRLECSGRVPLATGVPVAGALALAVLCMGLLACSAWQSGLGETGVPAAGGSGSSGSSGSSGGAGLGRTTDTVYYLADSRAYSVEVHSTSVVWGGIALFEAPKGGGGTPSLLASGGGGIFVIRLTESTAYWLEMGASSERRGWLLSHPGRATGTWF